MDRIKLPRIPRKKWTGTTLEMTTLWTGKEIVYIDPNCNRNLADMYCERLDAKLMSYFYNDSHDESSIQLSTYLGELNCQRSIKYGQCLQKNFRLKCQTTFSQTFSKVERLNGRCSSEVKSKIRPLHNQAMPCTITSSFVLGESFVFVFILKKYLSVL